MGGFSGRGIKDDKGEWEMLHIVLERFRGLANGSRKAVKKELSRAVVGVQNF